MTEVSELSALLSDALAPEPREADRRFAARVRLAVIEEERYRLARKAALRRIGSDFLVMAGLIGPALGVARVLAANESLAGPTAGLLVATLVVGGWIALSGELRRFQAC